MLEELDRRRAVVYIHPIEADCCRGIPPGIPSSVLEYTADTTRVILQWIAARCSDIYPGIRPIFSHAGGLIVGAVGRLSILIATGLHDKMPSDLRAEVARLYYEVASSTDAVTMSALRSLVPTTNILLGTDSPFAPAAPTLDQLMALGLPQEELLSIERNNAEGLFKRFQRFSSQ